MNIYSGLDFAYMIRNYLSAKDDDSALAVADDIINSLANYIDECAEHGGWYEDWYKALSGE